MRLTTTDCTDVFASHLEAFKDLAVCPILLRDDALFRVVAICQTSQKMFDEFMRSCLIKTTFLHSPAEVNAKILI